MERAERLQVERVQRVGAVDREDRCAVAALELDHASTGTFAWRNSTIPATGAPGVKTSATPASFSSRTSSLRDRSADDDEHVVAPVLAETVEDLGHERHVRAGEDRDPDGVGVLLHGRLDDLLRRLVEAGVDDLHAGVAERPRDDLRAPVVSVETGLGDDDPDLPGHVGKYMSVRLTVIGSSPAWPNPGSAQSGYLLAGSRDRLAPPRLRPRRPRPAARERPARDRRDRDHPLPPRPLGRPRSVGLARGVRRGGRRPELWLPPGGVGQLETFAANWGNPQHVRERVRPPRVRAWAGRGDRGFSLEAHQRAALHHAGPRVSRLRERDDALPTPATPAPGDEVPALAHGADLFLCEATLASPDRDGPPRGHLTAEEAQSFADGPFLLTHRPVELPARRDARRRRRPGRRDLAAPLVGEPGVDLLEDAPVEERPVAHPRHAAARRARARTGRLGDASTFTGASTRSTNAAITSRSWRRIG